MTSLEIIWFASLLGGVVALITILASKRKSGNVIAAAMLSAAFAAFTAVQIGTEGVIGFFTNHTQNLTGVQVWIALVMCVMIALLFIAPRARAAGMNVPLWALLCASTASIGILAMCARLFWLEGAASEATTPKGAAPA